MGRFEDLKAKYQAVLRVIEQQNVRLDHLHVQDDKLFLQGAAPSDDAKNKVWDQIKLVNPKCDDITADISVSRPQAAAAVASAGAGSAPTAAGQSYTVQPGDSLSKISKQFYGDPNKYMKIFEANRDKLQDPNKVQPGQVLRIPNP